jgi:cell division protein FtsN
MEDQASWKGHSFTLLVFGGIVVLCSVFFALGMLVGRSQGQRAGEAAAAAKAAAETAGSASAGAGSSVVTSAPPDDSAVILPANAYALNEGLKTGSLSADRAANTADVRPEKVDTPIVPSVAPKPARKAAPPPAAAPAPAKKAAPPAAANVKMTYLQVAAVGTDTAARKAVDDLRKKGFTGVITGGVGKDPYRVRVGPFSNAADEDKARSRLVSLGYMPIRK